MQSGGPLAAHFEEARRRQSIYGGALDTALLELGSIDESRLLPLLDRSTGLPVASPGDLAALATQAVDATLFERLEVAPIGLDADGTVWIASFGSKLSSTAFSFRNRRARTQAVRLFPSANGWLRARPKA